MRRKLAQADAAIARIAANQHGAATLTQLIRAGLTPAGVRRRVASGRLYRIYRGVFAVGHPGLSNEGRWMAAVLACGDGAVLSHLAGAQHWAMLSPALGVIDVTVPGRGGRAKRPGLRIHRSSLPSSDTTIRKGIPVTTPARTLADVKCVVTPGVHRRAVRQAEFLGLPLDDVGTDHTRSELERRFLCLCRRYRLPAPQVNVPVGTFTVDFLWPQQRLVVETDGYAAHRGRQAFEDDHARELELSAGGYAVRRFTPTQLERDPGAVARAVRAALGG